MTAVVNGQSISVSQPRGGFTIPWTAGPVTSFTAQPRDAAGNVGADGQLAVSRAAQAS